MIEDHLEELTLEWLAGLGYQCLAGDDVSLGGKYEGRTKYSQVVLRPRLEEAIARLNPDLPYSTKTAAAEQLASYGSQSLIDGNREVYGWLRGGIPVQVIEEMISLAKELNAAKPPDDMSDEEWAFYQALEANESATRELGHPILRALAVKLTD